MNKRWLRGLARAARSAGVSVHILRQWIADGLLPSAQRDPQTGRWLIDADELHAAAGTPEMKQELDDLKQRVAAQDARIAAQDDHIESLRRLIEWMRTYFADNGIPVPQVGYTPTLNAQIRDNLTTGRGVALFLGRHGVTYGTARRWADNDKTFPYNDPIAILRYAISHTTTAGHRARGRTIHQCEYYDCACRTFQPPLPPPNAKPPKKR